MERVWLAFNIIDQLDPLDRLCSLCIGLHGRRPSEIMALTPKNIDFATETITISVCKIGDRLRPGTKSEHPLKYRIHETVLEPLRDRCAQLEDDDYIFSQNPTKPGDWRRLSKKIMRLVKQAGLESNPFQIVRSLIYGADNISWN